MTREEAINRIKERLSKEAWCTDETDIEALCEIIPELRKSEDERIREQIEQALIEHDWDNTYKVSKDDCLAYLEKHKEQKPIFRVGDDMRTWDEAEEGIKEGLPYVVSIDAEYYHCNNELICISEQNDYEFPPMNRQKPAEWSEEGEKRVVELKTFIAQCNGFNKANRQKAFELIDALRPNWKPSEDEEK